MLPRSPGRYDMSYFGNAPGARPIWVCDGYYEPAWSMLRSNNIRHIFCYTEQRVLTIDGVNG